MSDNQTVDDLVTWLRQQLDDDERVARKATLGGPGEWARGDRTEWRGGTDVWDLNSRSDVPDRGFYRLADGLDPEVVVHIACHDPARVLAEVDAKRRILDYLEYDRIDVSKAFGPPETVPGKRPAIAHPVLRMLGLAYADRPGYRDEWRP